MSGDALGGHTPASPPSAAELEAGLLAAGPAPNGRGSVELICVRIEQGRHECPERVGVTPERGVEGDRWVSDEHPLADAKVTLMSVRVARLVTGRRRPLHAPGDNFLVDLDLSEKALPAGTRLRLGGALLEVTALPHTGCGKFRERFGLEALRWVNAHRELRLRGVNCRVLEAGPVAVGDPIERV